MTNFILLIGAGLFSRATGAFQKWRFNHLLGADVDDLSSAGNGPGSYDVRGNVWHLNCCNPEAKTVGLGWTIFNAIFGWTNSATSKLSRICCSWNFYSDYNLVGTVLSYVFYWLAVIVVLIYMKFTEVNLHFMLPFQYLMIYWQGRTKLLGRESAAGIRRREARDISGATSGLP
jgi:high-affinity iron transporter